MISPYCHSFQPPHESGILPTRNAAYAQNHPFPPYDYTLVFDYKRELDSRAYFLRISATYFENTGDLAFFGRYKWVEAVEAAVDAAGAMRVGTYDGEGWQCIWLVSRNRHAPVTLSGSAKGGKAREIK